VKSNVLFQSRFSRQQLTTILTLKLWSRDRAHGMTQAHVVFQLAALGKGLRALLTAERFRLLLVGGNFSSPFEDFVVSSEHVVTNFGPVWKDLLAKAAHVLALHGEVGLQHRIVQETYSAQVTNNILLRIFFS